MSNENEIRISIFHEKDSWKKIIANCIKPFFAEQIAKKTVEPVFVSLNNYQGDNIRLVFKCLGEHKELIADQMHDEFSLYLSLNPSTHTAESNYLGKEFFMDFPNDSLQYNLFDTDSEHIAHQFRLLISKKIIDFFSIEDFDDSSILSLLVHLLSSFLSAWEEAYNETISSKIEQIILEIRHKNSDTFLNDILLQGEEIFKENAEVLMDIYHDAIQNYNEISDDSDSSQLNRFYYKFLSNSKVSVNEGLWHKIYLPFDGSLVGQLGINGHSLILAYQLIRLCVNTEENSRSLS